MNYYDFTSRLGSEDLEFMFVVKMRSSVIVFGAAKAGFFKSSQGEVNSSLKCQPLISNLFLQEEDEDDLKADDLEAEDLIRSTGGTVAAN